MSLFERFSRVSHAFTLGQYLPDGKAFVAKNIPETNLNGLLFGVADQLRLVEESMDEIYCQYDFRTEDQFISEWESTLGIPDSCFDGRGTLEERRRDVIAKFMADGTQVADDYIAIAALYGVPIRVIPAIDENTVNFDFVFPFEFIDSKALRFTMIIEFITTINVFPLEFDFEFQKILQGNGFPFTFPLVFGSTELQKLRCLFRKIAPSNVDVIFREA